MNLIHRWLCRSRGWREKLADNILPWTLENVELGDDVLEIGPGPGLTTDLLRHRAGRITALEIDRDLAAALKSRMAGLNVTVVEGDATAMQFQNAQFSGATCFTMLHHVPSSELQDRLLQEVARVLKPGGIFVGVDSRQNLGMRLIHIWDTLVPINPATFEGRLKKAGFSDVFIDVAEERFRFHARRLV